MRRMSILVLLLSILSCVLGICFPWFEYSIVWQGPRLHLDRSSAPQASTIEQIRLLQLGPDLYPVLPDGLRGCFVMGSCGDCLFQSFPHRLHLSNTTTPRVYQLRLLRLVGVASLLANSLAVGSIAISLSRQHRRMLSYMLVIAITVALIGVVILVLIGPMMVGLWEPVPRWKTCQTSKPVMKCYQIPPVSNTTHTVSGVSDTAEWELQTVRYVGPTVTSLSLLLAYVAIVLWFQYKAA
jgi:hypothetical protein